MDFKPSLSDIFGLSIFSSRRSRTSDTAIKGTVVTLGAVPFKCFNRLPLVQKHHLHEAFDVTAPPMVGPIADAMAVNAPLQEASQNVPMCKCIWKEFT